MPREQTETDRQRVVEGRSRRPAADARARLLAGMPVTERRLELTGISTVVLGLEGARSPPQKAALRSVMPELGLRAIPRPTSHDLGPDNRDLGTA